LGARPRAARMALRRTWYWRSGQTESGRTMERMALWVTVTVAAPVAPVATPVAAPVAAPVAPAVAPVAPVAAAKYGGSNWSSSSQQAAM
jgi:hypothetical protein